MCQFQIVEDGIDLSQLERNVNPEVGATSVFFGTVRNIHEGKEVVSLEYECYRSLAVKEGQRILEEARDRFPVLEIRCQHRIGHLRVGEIAIGVVVFSRHRLEARKACSWVVDQVKDRVPIWKKEYYVTGDPEWVYCPHPHSEDHSESHGQNHSESVTSSQGRKDQAEFFSAQRNIESIGKAGLKKLNQARITVVGVGGLGTVVVENLARMGVGHVTLIDDDVVTASNLARQTLFTWDDVGMLKVEVASKLLGKINPWMSLKAIPQRLDESNRDIFLREADLVVDATDNFLAKFLIHDHCWSQRLDLVQAAVFQFEGRVHNFFFRDALSPCLRCLYPEIPSQVCGSCADTGILATTVSLFATLQANEVVKRILGKSGICQGEFLVWDLEYMSSQTLKWKKNPKCPLCAEGVENREELAMTRQVTTVAPGDVVITTSDIPAKTFPHQQCLDDGDYRNLDWEKLIDKNKRYVLVCRRGIRSSEMVRYLRQNGFENVFSLENGIDTYSKTFLHEKA